MQDKLMNLSGRGSPSSFALRSSPIAAGLLFRPLVWSWFAVLSSSRCFSLAPACLSFASLASDCLLLHCPSSGWLSFASDCLSSVSLVSACLSHCSTVDWCTSCKGKAVLIAFFGQTFWSHRRKFGKINSLTASFTFLAAYLLHTRRCECFYFHFPIFLVGEERKNSFFRAHEADDWWSDTHFLNCTCYLLLQKLLLHFKWFWNIPCFPPKLISNLLPER